MRNRCLLLTNNFQSIEQSTRLYAVEYRDEEQSESLIVEQHEESEQGATDRDSLWRALNEQDLLRIVFLLNTTQSERAIQLYLFAEQLRNEHIFRDLLLKNDKIHCTSLCALCANDSGTVLLSMSIAASHGISIFRRSTQRIVASFCTRPMQPEPGLCCQEGCASCVWLVYATELLDYYHKKYPTNTLERVKEDIADKIESPSVKEYVLMEISMTAKRFEQMDSLKRKKKPSGSK